MVDVALSLTGQPFEMSRHAITVYAVESKVNDIFSRLHGSLVEQLASENKSSVKGKGSVSAKLGGIAALFGIGEASAGVEAERSRESTDKLAGKLAIANKVHIMAKYYMDNS